MRGMSSRWSFETVNGSRVVRTHWHRADAKPTRLNAVPDAPNLAATESHADVVALRPMTSVPKAVA